MPEPKLPLYLEALLPAGAAWVVEQERRILSEGVALTEAQQADARAVGVAHPEKIRVLALDRVPSFGGPVLQRAAQHLGVGSGNAAGMAMRYGIFVRKVHASDRMLLAHEMTHTAQYERFGGIPEFLRAYVHDVLIHGYAGAVLEAEANDLPSRL